MHCGKQTSVGKISKKWSRLGKLSLNNADGHNAGCYGNAGAKRGTGAARSYVSRKEEAEEVDGFVKF